MNALDTIYTEHLIDDGKFSIEQTMELFKKSFPLPNAQVHAKGLILVYELKVERNEAAWNKLAGMIIRNLNLDLVHSIQKWDGTDGVVSKLCIEYKRK